MLIYRDRRLRSAGESGNLETAMFFAEALKSTALFSTAVLLCLSWPCQAQKARDTPIALAWQVKGTWLVDGMSPPLRTGDALLPGSLLHPDAVAGDHSITVLLPDGQRVLYECFTVEDCTRGFRVPALYTRPQPFAVDMTARIHSVLAAGSPDGLLAQNASWFPREEAVAVLNSANRVHVAGLVASLSPGNYTYDLRPLDPAQPRQFHIEVKKTTPSLALTLPGPGLYILNISDDANTPRVDLFLAAIRPSQAAHFQSFRTARDLMEQWDGDYQGWPTHDFARAYLQSLMPEAKPPSTANAARVKAKPAVDATPEPGFLPRPGVFDKDLEVTLRCDVGQATIRYTVDGSQPIGSSPVYKAPIQVKGTELLIKAYAASAGKKDSAVVTGIFRIRQPGE